MHMVHREVGGEMKSGCKGKRGWGTWGRGARGKGVGYMGKGCKGRGVGEMGKGCKGRGVGEMGKGVSPCLANAYIIDRPANASSLT